MERILIIAGSVIGGFFLLLFIIGFIVGHRKDGRRFRTGFMWSFGWIILLLGGAAENDLNKKASGGYVVKSSITSQLVDSDAKKVTEHGHEKDATIQNISGVNYIVFQDGSKIQARDVYSDTATDINGNIYKIK